MAGSSWGAREELLHPRDRKGRFRKKWGLPEGVVDKILGMLAKFNEHMFKSDQEASDYIKSHGRGLQRDRKGAGAHRESAREIRRLQSDFKGITDRQRAGTSSPDDKSTIAAVDVAMEPSDRDLVLSRVVPPEVFGLNAQTVGGDGSVDEERNENEGLKEFTGRLIADRGYTQWTVGTPSQATGANIRMVMAAPKGTDMVHPPDAPPGDREVILPHDQELRITRIQRDGAGGWNAYVLATPRTPGETPAPEEGAPEAPTQLPAEAPNLPEP